VKIQEQANNSNNLNDLTIAIDPQAQVEFDDLPISGEQEERVKGGGEVFISLPDGVVVDMTRKGESKR
jgi:hypothetical protein